jgi:tmRNA-binding protein
VTENIKIIATNRKASFEYFLMEKFEAGLVLQGSEIKSIRAGQISIQESYVDVPTENEAWLVEAHIAPYEQAGILSTMIRNANANCSCTRNRSVNCGTTSASKAIRLFQPVFT